MGQGLHQQLLVNITCTSFVFTVCMSSVTICSGKFSWGAVVNVKIQTGINSHTLVFHMQSYWWVWFPGTEPAKIPRYTVYISDCTVDFSCVRICIDVRTSVLRLQEENRRKFKCNTIDQNVS